MRSDNSLDGTNITSSVDLEAVQSLLAMSQWSPPSPPQSETRTRGEEYNDGEKGWITNGRKEFQIVGDVIQESSKILSHQEIVKV